MRLTMVAAALLVLGVTGCSGTGLSGPVAVEPAGPEPSWELVAREADLAGEAVLWARVLDQVDGVDEENEVRRRTLEASRRARVEALAVGGNEIVPSQVLAAMKSREGSLLASAHRAMLLATAVECERARSDVAVASELVGTAHEFRGAEARAVWDLMRLHSMQAELKEERWIDVDGDGVGEYGTIAEISGGWPFRRGIRETNAGTRESGFWAVGDWNTEGKGLHAWRMNRTGTARQGGYVFSVFLPASGAERSWVGHQPAGGMLVETTKNSAVDVDMSEVTWCAYAVPRRFGVDGKRAFFILASETQLIRMWCENEQGMSGDEWVDPDSALVGRGVMAAPATDKVGTNGEKWTLLK